MPRGSYNNKKNAKKNAKLIMKLTKCDAVNWRAIIKILTS